MRSSCKRAGSSSHIAGAHAQSEIAAFDIAAFEVAFEIEALERFATGLTAQQSRKQRQRKRDALCGIRDGAVMATPRTAHKIVP